MDALAKLEAMLNAADAAHDAAKSAGDTAAAAAIRVETIRPLESAIAGMVLLPLHAQAQKLSGVAAKLERSLIALQGRINRLFLDRLIEKARKLGLANVPEAPRPEPVREDTTVAETATTSGAAAGEATTTATTDAPRVTDGAIAGGGAAAVSRPTGKVIDITDEDLDALQRVAQSEVGHFAKYGEAELRGGLAAVVDTVLNRVAHANWRDTIQKVIDQPKQFSAINATGSWTGLPKANANVTEIVEEHVKARAAGGVSEIKGATHFLNPHLSSASALAAWGNHVVRNAVAIYGSEANKDVHYHGFAPGTALPPSYTVARKGVASSFDAVGRSIGGPASNADIRNAILRICREELARFDGGSAKETEDPQYLRVGDYWRAVGQPNDGRTLDASGKRPAWSAAFISFVLKEAGAGDRFKYSVGHCHYFQDCVDRTGPALYEAVSAADAIPKPGDIVHYGRSDAEKHDFAAARADYGNDSFYPSHSAIVVEVDRDRGEIKTIGGNESDSVRMATYALDKDGRLKPRRRGNRSLPWIGMLRLI
ncbi:DUF2272 domain-containing protein [Pikeienuella piscinae]|uniref:DUF2272 domain-containing protein n=1 Tax=Pikeienuella piscinae TaxID=2748098 RepID=A0A7L5BXR7_9RHOB|nr:DUF2272 domain-containing protein [Pikeienuella piscinae]QIE55933.1 DUF2272 domain-containing protein [Pikeienuella piscinae]